MLSVGNGEAEGCSRPDGRSGSGFAARSLGADTGVMPGSVDHGVEMYYSAALSGGFGANIRDDIGTAADPDIRSEQSSRGRVSGIRSLSASTISYLI